MRGQQLRPLLDERGRDVAGDEVRILQNRLQEWDIGGDPADPELRQRPPRPRDRGLERPPSAGELDQHRVEVRADLHAGVYRATIQPDSRTASRSIGGDRSGVRAEPVGWVLGGYPALQRRTVDPDHILG